MADEEQKKKAPKKKVKEKAAPLIETGDGHIVSPVPARLRVMYKEQVIPKLKEQFGYKSPMQIPRITKVVINAGLGKATQNIKIVDHAIRDIASITGQKPITCKSKIAISNFKLRAGLPIGVKVTLRGDNMWEFLDRLINFALPRIRDFRGVPASGFDGNGNFTMGLKEQFVFPEVEYDSAEATFGMNISIATTAKTDDEALALLAVFGFPFRKKTSTKKAA